MIIKICNGGDIFIEKKVEKSYIISYVVGFREKLCDNTMSLM